MKKMNIDNCVHPQPNKKFHNDFTKGHTLEYGLNIRAILALFYLGAGGFDVGGFASFFGLPGGRSWKMSFHRYSSKIYDVVIYVAATSDIVTIGLTVSYDMEWNKRSTGNYTIVFQVTVY